MNREDVTSLYTMEELLSIVGELAEKYTSKESSSVTYEKASQLMEAVIYCIAHFESRDNLLRTQALPMARDAYRIGYENVIRKVKDTQKRYNELINFFDDFGNRNYRDTVEKALLGFFLYYNPLFAPMENIITMDYPVFGLDMSLEGIDIIAEYIDAIWEEQQYLRKFPRNYVIGELRCFHPKYENEFFNLREVLDGVYEKR